MGTSVVIISKDQEASLPPMLAALRAQLPDASRVWVLDRCTDGSLGYLLGEHETTVTKSKGRGFEAGAARNLGLAAVDEGYDVLFLDGDRVPAGLSHELLAAALDLYDFTLVKAEKDKGRPWFAEGFVENPAMGMFWNSFYTCGTLARAPAIKEVQALNHGNLFNPLLNGAYGCEDLYLGDMAYHIGLSCGGFPASCYLKGEVGVLDGDYKRFRMEEQHELRTNLRLLLRHKPDAAAPDIRRDMRSRLRGR